MAVTEDTDLEALALSQNKRFWKLIDDAVARGKKRASSIWRTSKPAPVRAATRGRVTNRGREVMASGLSPRVKRIAKPKASKPENVILYEVRNEIAFITLNRPEKMNALNGALSDALCATWSRFEADPAAKVAILTGAGKHFCAGADVSPGAIDREVPFQVHQGYPQNGITVFKPIVGAIKGYTLGAGYALAVRGCDITIAGESMLMGFPEARIGTPLPPMEYSTVHALQDQPRVHAASVERRADHGRAARL